MYFIPEPTHTDTHTRTHTQISYAYHHHPGFPSQGVGYEGVEVVFPRTLVLIPFPGAK